tara:strand:- start:47 stop:637 length:591 start_codon:yes stop_codon:yes gene_type:complete
MNRKVQLTTRQPKLYSYILACDVGGAPCVEDGCLTIAICKQVIRRNAKVGDTVVGISGYNLGKKKKIIFIATITKMVTMEEYGDSPRTDSIYTSDLKLKPNPFHDCTNYKRDISGKNVIISTDFIYFGKKHIDVPVNLHDIIPGHGHQSIKNEPFKQTLLELFATEKKNGVGKRGDYTGKKNNKCGNKLARKTICI